MIVNREGNPSMVFGVRVHVYERRGKREKGFVAKHSLEFYCTQPREHR
jgi:hypothetical protein